ATVFVPASASARCPYRSKVIANGTVPGSEVTAGCADRPDGPARKTSTELAAPLVVTTRCDPPGVNPIWPGVPVNAVDVVVPRPRSRCQDGCGIRRPPDWTNPATDPPP